MNTSSFGKGVHWFPSKAMDPGRIADRRTAAVVCVAAAATISLVGIIGWLLDLELLRNTFGGAHGLRFSTAVFQLLVAFAILLPKPAAGRRTDVLFLATLIFMPLTLVEVAYSFSDGAAGISPFSMRDRINDPPSPLAALGLACISITVLATRWHKPLSVAACAWPALLALVVSLQALISGFWHITPEFGITPFARMSQNAALANVLLASAALLQVQAPCPTRAAPFNWKDELTFVVAFPLPALAYFQHVWSMHVINSPEYHVGTLIMMLATSMILTYIFNAVAAEGNKALKLSADVLQANAQLFERTFANAPVGLAIVSLDGTRLRINKQHCINSGRTADELIGTKLASDIHPEDVNPAHFAKLSRGEINEFERDLRKVHPSGRSVWLHVHATLQRDINGDPSHIVVLCHDIDENRQREEAHALIVGEMNHRIKNTLATIQGLAREIAERTHSPEGFHAALQDRLMAISRVHDSLMQANWEGMTLHRIFKSAFSNVFEAYTERYAFHGADVEIAPQASVLLSLVLHELMTNSIKYGAMSVPKGRLAITSLVSEQFGEKVLELTWSESGCHGVTAPVRQGFGSFMLDRGVKHGLGGTSEIVYRPEGLLCRLRIPVGAAPR